MPATLQSVHDETLRRDLSTRSLRTRRIRAWEVVHACDFARDIADVVEAQIAAGMRPYLLTVGADVAPKASVLQTWQDVRRWRKALEETGAHLTPQLIHAHSFSSAMAAVRMDACVVYDLRQSIEEYLASSSSSIPGAWINRSFRTAEQFVLGKAAAVVVHSAALREDCIARGVAPQGVFVIPDPDSTDMAGETPGFERAHSREARNWQHIAEKYDEVYRYAYSRKKKGDRSADSSGSLVPIPANL